ncbi:MAG TPA: Ig-like domain-containing protein, partial [Candidatus Polarisedimenticolia bacterium]|nr:Ig-like domain-containing protein [Candidatus Polarisedimenticolia bacterium]
MIETPNAPIVYVSLRSGTVPTGVEASVTNISTGEALQAAMIDGGLDPVALEASEGDSIQVETRDDEGGFQQFSGMVSLKYPPVVVRTGPTRGAVDVGLNSIILVVFSEPIDERTLSPETIELTIDGERVPIEVRPSGDRLRAEVDPGALLPSRQYTLVIRRGVRDRDGLSLEEEYRTSFSTGPVTTSILVSAESLRVALGQPLSVRATLLDGSGNPLPGTSRRVAWSATGDALVVDMGDNTAVVRPRQPGALTVTATFDDRAGALDVDATAPSFVSVSAGSGYTCALSELGYAYCWGTNGDGQIGGVEHAAKTGVPTAIDADRLTMIAAGDRYTCGLGLSGPTQCWGGDRDWQPRSEVQYVEVATGLNQACGREADSRVSCWGMFPDLFPDSWYYLFGAFPFIQDRSIEALTSGDTHSCALGSDGSVLCWGRNEHGQLGDGTRAHTRLVDENDAWSPTTAQVITSVPFSSISAGARHTCALATSGQAYCWGDVNGTHALLPQTLAGGITFASLSAGDGFTCGLTPAGRAYCWGRNTFGQLGTGTTADASEPVPVSSEQSFTAISAGRDHTCGIMSDGLLYCWGRGLDGELGNGLMAD